MINYNIFSSIFENYEIGNVILLKDKETHNFIISNMPSCISVDRWDYLENILSEITKSQCNIFPYNQAIKYFSEEIIKKGVVIK